MLRLLKIKLYKKKVKLFRKLNDYELKDNLNYKIFKISNLFLLNFIQ